MWKKINEWFSRIDLTRNTALKVFSLLLAVILWLIIMDYENPVMNRKFENIEIRYAGKEMLVGRGLYAESALNETVDITVTGNRRDVIALQSDDVKAYVDMAGVKQGPNTLPLSVSVNKSAVSISSYNKTAINVEIDQIVSKRFTIVLYPEGEVAEDYYIDSVICSPSSIEVTGPSKLIEKIKEVFAIYDIAGLNESQKGRYQIEIIDQDDVIVTDVTPAFNQVLVDVKVGTVKTVPLIADFVKDEDTSLIMVEERLSSDTVTLKGVVEQLNLIHSIKTDPIISEAALGQQRIDVSLTLPKNVEQIKPLSLYAIQRYDQEITREFAIESSAFKHVDLATHLKLRYLTAELPLSLTVRGLSSDLAALTPEDFDIALQLSGVTVGEQRVPYLITAPRKVQIVAPASDERALDVVVENRE